jgi:DNA invertase Pin-like site-specific DNA recombinase
MKTTAPAPARDRRRNGARYILYARTAAGGRAAVDAQLAALRAVVVQRADGRVVQEHADVDVPAGAGLGLAALLHDLAAGGADAVLVTDLARLARSPSRLATVLAAVEQSGARLLTTTEAA